MAVAFQRGRLVCETGGDGTGFTAAEASYVAHDLREEHPDAIVAILPAKRSWEGGWPWNTEARHRPLLTAPCLPAGPAG